jgi:quinone-modifying oxidoreductase subunit QmoC
MASTTAIAPSAELRATLASQGGASASRCYQCATCSSVCELAPSEAPFPRRQMLWAQWGLGDRLAADAGIWLCHQCNDCNTRCPRDAQPGDVLQTLRAAAVESLAFPSVMGKLVGRAKATWPLLIGLPIVFWIVLLGATTGLHIPGSNPELSALEGPFHYEEFVPHAHIYIVYTLVTLWVLMAAWVGGRRFWKRLGESGTRHGSFLAKLVPAVIEISTHKRFNQCGEPSNRKWGHLAVMWGFVGAAVTSGLLIPYLYRHTLFSWMPLPFPHDYPLPLDHPVKWLGNISAVILIIGGALLYINRSGAADRQTGQTTAFDRFFLWTVLAVIVTGVLTEALRFLAPPVVACSFYVLHLGVVLTLFITFPYSKFAHLLYRTLAMVHQLMTEEKEA